MRLGWIGWLLAALPAAGPALAGDAAAGSQKAAVCIACHGVNGNSANPQWPSLAGQHESYIVAQLELFKQGIRVDPLMTPMAVGLSHEDMADLGAHFAQQTPAGLEADPSNWRTGQQLYRGGDVARELPACIACHGPEGKGNAPAAYPALRAQHAVYAYKQLRDFSTGARLNPTSDAMQYVAARLTDAEMRALASYMQGLR